MAKVKVNQNDGQIRISTGGDEPVTYNVTDGHTNVADDKLVLFLSQVDGSEVVGKK